MIMSVAEPTGLRMDLDTSYNPEVEPVANSEKETEIFHLSETKVIGLHVI